MTMNSNYKLYMPLLGLTKTEKICSVSPHKVLLERDKYQDRSNNEWEQEFYDIYKSYSLEGKAD